MKMPSPTRRELIAGAASSAASVVALTAQSASAATGGENPPIDHHGDLIEQHRSAWMKFVRLDAAFEDVEFGRVQLSKVRAGVQRAHRDLVHRAFERVEEQIATIPPATIDGCARVIEYVLEDDGANVLCNFHVQALETVVKALRALAAGGGT